MVNLRISQKLCTNHMLTPLATEPVSISVKEIRLHHNQNSLKKHNFSLTTFTNNCKTSKRQFH